MTASERALVFGDDAEAYDRYRPAYPQETIDTVLSLTDVVTAVEVGAGTGKATEQTASSARRIVAVEPSAQMAGVLEAKALPGVVVEVASLESWRGPEQDVDLVYAAQSWHWVHHETAYRRVLGWLRPGGVLAMMWNVPRSEAFLEPLYEAHAPSLMGFNRGSTRRDWEAELAEAGFSDVGQLRVEWNDQLEPHDFAALSGTYSHHMTLPPEEREALLEAIEKAVAVDPRLGIIEYVTDVFYGYR